MLYRITRLDCRKTTGSWTFEKAGRFLESCAITWISQWTWPARRMKQIYASAPGGAAGGDMSVLLQLRTPCKLRSRTASSGHRKLGRERLEVFRGEGAAIWTIIRASKLFPVRAGRNGVIPEAGAAP